jgi:hypothetical protein
MPCEWATLTQLCGGLVHDVYARSADACRESCCIDSQCTVYQFADPVTSFSNFGTGCWRGQITTCNGPALNASVGTTAGRKIGAALDATSDRAESELTRGTSGNTALTEQLAMTLSIGVAACLLCSATLCLCGRRLPCCRRAHRRVVPYVRGVERALNPVTIVMNSREAKARSKALTESQQRIEQVIQEQQGRIRELLSDRFRFQDMWVERAATKVQRRFRHTLAERRAAVLRRRTAARKIQLAARYQLCRKNQAARTIQRLTRHTLSQFVTQRKEARRLMQGLSQLLEQEAEEAAAATFAQRFDAHGRDIDDEDEEDYGGRMRGADGGMDAYLDSLRREAGLVHPETPSAQASTMSGAISATTPAPEFARHLAQNDALAWRLVEDGPPVTNNSHGQGKESSRNSFAWRLVNPDTLKRASIEPMGRLSSQNR